MMLLVGRCRSKLTVASARTDCCSPVVPNLKPRLLINIHDGLGITDSISYQKRSFRREATYRPARFPILPVKPSQVPSKMLRSLWARFCSTSKHTTVSLN